MPDLQMPANDALFEKSFIAHNRTPLHESLDLVAGYGSLRNIPEPGLAYVGRGTLHGFTKRFNVVEHRVRGTPEFPGRVLGLTPAPCGCSSVALFRIAPQNRRQVLSGLWARELNGVPYAPRVLGVRADGGDLVEALTFVPVEGPDVVEESIERIAQILCRARGQNGTNRAYFDAVDAFDREVPALRSAHLAALADHLARCANSDQSFGLHAA